MTDFKYPEWLEQPDEAAMMSLLRLFGVAEEAVSAGEFASADAPQWLIDLVNHSLALADRYGYAQNAHTSPPRLLLSTARRATLSEGSVGVVLEQGIQDAMKHVQYATSMARAVRRSATAYWQECCADNFVDCTRELLTLRGFLWGALAPGRNQYWVATLKYSGRGDEYLELLESALREGVAVYDNGRLEKGFWKDSTLNVVHWETKFTAEDLITWLKRAYELAP